MAAGYLFDAPIDTVKLCPRRTSGHTHVEGVTKESSHKASELLTTNHWLYHTRWNSGFHNHIAHHLCTLWALGASPKAIQDMWDYQVPYQAPIDRDRELVQPHLNLSDATVFANCLGQDKRYLDFLEFFRSEIVSKGVPNTVREYVLKGDDRANDIHGRMYCDLVHPMIHLGVAVEFQQPALIAEALAAACIHDPWPGEFISATEAYVKENPASPALAISQMLENMRNDPIVGNAVRDDDPFNKIADGLMKRLDGPILAPFLAQFRIAPTEQDLHRKTAEMMYMSAYMMGASQRPGRREKIDFVLLHNTTLAGFYPAIIAQDWLTLEEKIRLVETKVRVDAVMYAACKCPKLYPQRILDYRPLHPEHGWAELIQRSIVYRDEGHACKLLRSLFATVQHYPDVGFDFEVDSAGSRSDVNDSGIDLPDCDRKQEIHGRERDTTGDSRRIIMQIAHLSLDSIELSLQPGGTKMPPSVAEERAKAIGKGGEFVVANMTRWVFYNGLEHAWDHVPEL